MDGGEDLTEEYLLRRANSGDKEALDQLIRRYYDQIYTYCYHHTNEKEAAEDICQDAFVSMLEHIGEYKHYHKFLNYLYVIARNKCKDYYKKKKPLYLDEIPEAEGKRAFQQSELEERLIIKELVRHLPEELREVVILRFYMELRYQDIARIMNISNSLVKYRVKKAISYLQTEMERSGL